ncbi:MAG: ATP-binding protein [Clostridiales bacterium]|nr:ATP-binding protein [Clostridiales bacterium]
MGTDEFSRLLSEGYAYIDKTEMIGSFIDTADVYLITRPRRFGKTMNMKMLRDFFSNAKDSESKGRLFHKLKIWGNEAVRPHQGQYPVIFITLKDAGKTNKEDMLDKIAVVMYEAYSNYDFLLTEGILNATEQEMFSAVFSMNAVQSQLESSLKNLSKWLHRYYGKRAVVLIDEYDTPLIAATNCGYYDEAVNFMRSFLTEALKGNESLQFACLTGILRIAKESIFSELNNVTVCDTFSELFASSFGFTDSEVCAAAKEFGVYEQMSEIRSWYNGYNFGGIQIYNPWSIMNFLKNRKLAPYWANTSENALIGSLLKYSSRRTLDELDTLMSGGSLTKYTSVFITFKDVFKNPSSLYSLLAASGYLKTSSSASSLGRNGFYSVVSIPNHEIRGCFLDLIAQWLNDLDLGDLVRDISVAMTSGQADELEALLNKYLLVSGSFYDGNESFYHGFMLALTAFCYEGYAVRSNRESGEGRFDIALFPLKEGFHGVLMEYKYASCADGIEALLDESVKQVAGKKYLSEFDALGVPVYAYGIVFHKKTCRVKSVSL